MNLKTQFGTELRGFALCLQLYPGIEHDATRRADERERKGMEPMASAKEMMHELAPFSQRYSGPRPAAVLGEHAENLMKLTGGSYPDAVIVTEKTYPSLAALDRVWQSAPERVSAALKSLGPGMWEELDLRDPEAVASLVLGEVLRLKEREDARQERAR